MRWEGCCAHCVLKGTGTGDAKYKEIRSFICTLFIVEFFFLTLRCPKPSSYSSKTISRWGRFKLSYLPQLELDSLHYSSTMTSLIKAFMLIMFGV